MRAVRGLVVALLLGAATRGLAAEGVRLDYEVHYGLLQILSIRTSAWIADERYQTESRMRTEGIVGLLFPWEAEARARGTTTGAAWSPARFWAEGVYRSQRRRVEIDYTGDVVRASVDPPAEEDFRAPVPGSLQQGTMDPLTASLAALRAGCTGTLPVFDGRRRYDMQLQGLGDADLPASRHGVFAGPTRRCRATIVARAGFWEPDGGENEEPSHLDFWLARPRPDVPAVPVYLELSGARGTLRIWLRAIEPLTAPPEG